MTVGCDNFAKVREIGSRWVDKSYLIERFINCSHQCTALLRPRLFGKSLNLSMMRYFFDSDCTSERLRALFDGLRITQCVELCDIHMGKYAVISVNFKACHGPTWLHLRERLCFQLARTLEDHHEYLDVLIGAPNDYSRILAGRIAEKSDTIIASLIPRLISLVHAKTGKRVVLLVDEYDVPLNVKLDSDDDHSARRRFFSHMYSRSFNSNPALFKACLMGVVETQGSGVLAGINDLGIASLDDQRFGDCFGFTQEEAVECLMAQFGYSEPEAMSELTMEGGIMAWYGGYRFGDQELINPWSFMKYVYCGQKFDTYWIARTPRDSLSAFMCFGQPLMDALQELFRLGVIEGRKRWARIDIAKFDPQASFRPGNVWTQHEALYFLCMAGYLGYCANQDGRSGKLWIPNREIYTKWVDIVRRITYFHNETSMTNDFKCLIDAFRSFNVEIIKAVISHKLLDIQLQTADDEYIYQRFICGLLVLFDSDFRRSTNEPEWRGFTNSMLHFDDIEKTIIIEFTKAVDDTPENSANGALQKIIEKRFFEFAPRCHDILLLGCAISEDNAVEIKSATIGAHEK